VALQLSIQRQTVIKYGTLQLLKMGVLYSIKMTKVTDLTPIQAFQSSEELQKKNVITLETFRKGLIPTYNKVFITLCATEISTENGHYNNGANEKLNGHGLNLNF